MVSMTEEPTNPAINKRLNEFAIGIGSLRIDSIIFISELFNLAATNGDIAMTTPVYVMNNKLLPKKYSLLSIFSPRYESHRIWIVRL